MKQLDPADFTFISRDGAAPPVLVRPSLSYWLDVWNRLRADKRTTISACVLLILIAFTLFGPALWQVDPNAQYLHQISRPPSGSIQALLVDSSQRWQLPVAVSVAAPARAGSTPLPAPANLQVAGTPHTYSVRLRWSPVPGATHYQIYRHYRKPSHIGEAGLPLGSTLSADTIGYEDSLKLRNRTYYYSVTAHDGYQESPHFAVLAVPVQQAISLEGASDLNLIQQTGDTPLPERIQLPPHPFGTDYLGRDILARLIHGARTSLFIGLVAPLIFVSIGTVYGALAGFWGGRADGILMRFADFVVALPFILFVILFRMGSGVQSGESGINALLLAFILLLWPATARLVRGLVLQIKSSDFVQAAQLMGASVFYIVGRQILPNAAGAILVTLTFAIPATIFTEAFLSFIGMGVALPTPSWGSMSYEGLKSVLVYPHELLFPSLFISVTVLSFNLLGDGLRDALDARLKNRT